MSESRGASNFLTVDECVRPRANSDPTAGAWCKAGGLALPEITVEDCTDNEVADITSAHDEGGLFGIDATPRRRANTCPEDLFRKKNGRPPTPPPTTFRRGSRSKPGIKKPVLCQSVSFVHHKLSKLTEDTSEVLPSTTPFVEGNDKVDSIPTSADGTKTGRNCSNGNGCTNTEDKHTSTVTNHCCLSTGGNSVRPDCVPEAGSVNQCSTGDHHSNADRTDGEPSENKSNKLSEEPPSSSFSSSSNASSSLCPIDGASMRSGQPPNKTSGSGQRSDEGVSGGDSALKVSARPDDAATSSSDSEASGSDAHYRSKSSVDCRYSRNMSKPRGLDGTRLQAC